MTWNESYSVGNAVLDSDHHILMNLLNQLHDALDTGQSRDVVGSVVNVLTEYVEHHFQREEAILAEVGYPTRDDHGAQHRKLEARFRDIRDRWQAGERNALGDEVLDFLQKWLTEHILVTDKAYKPWLESSEAGNAGEGAKHQ
ncbi:MAG TPA: bacteriohemerythrin [Candidatus Omnitrophota bacterium]|nr:bacteriohemerythrin [Candidatus Omnitrophota bacterium]